MQTSRRWLTVSIAAIALARSELAGTLPAAAQNPLQNALVAFQRSTLPGVWPNLQKAVLLIEIQARLGNPFLVYQGPQPFCGPAAIVFELVRKQPARYVQFCQQLFETGGFNGVTGKRVAATGHLRGSRIANGLSQVDWMLMATLRESENWFFDVDANGGLLANGVTTPSEMVGWTYNVLGCRSVHYESTYFWGEEDALREAGRVVREGGVAFPMIHGAMISGGNPFIAFPNHWVALLGNVQIRDCGWFCDDHISFDVYSWAQRRHIEIDEEPFEDYFWGVVTGRF